MISTQVQDVKPKISRKVRGEMKQNYKNRDIIEVLQCISQAKMELEAAHQNFSFAVEPLMVDMYTYQIKAAQAKYRYLLQKARDMGIEQREYVEKVVIHRANNL